MKPVINWCLKHQTNLLATLYIIVIHLVAGVFHIAKQWTTKDWPVKCLTAIDKPAKFLREAYTKSKEKDTQQ